MRTLLIGTLASAIVCNCVLAALASDQEVVHFTGQLDRGKLEDRSNAARQLGAIGPAAADSVPALVKLLNNDDPGLRYEVIVALGRIKSNPKESVPALIRAISDPSPSLRHVTIGALRHFGPAAKAAIPQLRALLKDKEPLLATSAARALLAIETDKAADTKEEMATLIGGLKSEQSEVSAEALYGLAAIGAPAVPAIRELLDSSNPQVSINACDALAAIGETALPAADRLVLAASSSDSSLRWHAISALGDLGATSTSAMTTLITALDDSDAQVKFSSHQSLLKLGKAAVPSLVQSLKTEKSQRLVLPVIAEIGPDAEEAVTTLTALLNSNDAETQREVILALASIGGAAKSSTPQLIKLFEDKQFPYRPAAAYALGKFGAKDAESALKAAANLQDNPFLRLVSSWALLQIDPSNKDYVTIALPELTKALENDRPEIRREAALALGRLGSQAKGAVSALRLHLKDKDSNIRRESLVALAEIGPDSQAAVTEIMQLLKDGDVALRPTACYALGRIGAAAKPAAPRLRQILLSRDAHERTVAAWALVQIEPGPETSKEAIPFMIAALQGASNPSVRAEAAKTLGQIGSGSPTVEAALKGALKDSDVSVRKAAELALSQRK